MLFEINNLTKVFGTRTVLDISELGLEKGKIYGLLGPNGAGKTTLLEILSFLSPPTTGRIHYDSEPVEYSSQFFRKARREVVLVPQNPILFTNSVFKNVEFGLKVRKVHKKDRARTVMEMLELVGLKHMAWEKGHKLSGGETQRAAIARALACSPKVIFFDEPTSNVDIENQAAIENIIRYINREKGISIIMTTHDLIQSARLVDRAVYLHGGRLAESVAENIFTAVVVVDEGGNMFGLIQDSFKIPLQSTMTGKIKLSVDPRQIGIFRESETMDWSDLQKGRLIQVSAYGNDIKLMVDVGIPLNAVLSREQYRLARFAVGDLVGVRCAPDGIEIL